MEVNELQLISHFLLFCNLGSSLDDLCRQSVLFSFVLINQGSFLPILLFKEFLYPFSFNISSSAVFTSHQNLSLEIVGVFPDFCDGHVGLL